MYATRSRAHLAQGREEHLHLLRISHHHRKRHRAHNLLPASATSSYRGSRSFASPRRSPSFRKPLQEVVQSLFIRACFSSPPLLSFPRSEFILFRKGNRDQRH